MFSLIVAFDEKRGIGKSNDLPWYIPKDLAYFKETTLNHPVIMGYNTYMSIGRPLPNRLNYVVSSKTDLDLGEKVIIINDLAGFFDKHKDTEEEIFVIGGKTIYEASLDVVKKMYITHIPGTFDVDTHFPKVDLESFRKIRSEIVFPEEIEFAVYERKEK